MRRQTRKKRTYFVNVAGVSFDNDDGSSRQTIISRCKPGETLRLIREPDNKYDPGAIKVTRRNGEQIGYIPSDFTRNEDARGLGDDIDAGVKFRCRIAAITGTGPPGLLHGVTIEITDGDW